MDNATHTEPATSSTNIRTLMAATAERVGDKVRESRKRLTTALHDGEKMIVRVKDKAVENAMGTDLTLRKHPYEALAFALVTGALIGIMCLRFSQTHKAVTAAQP